MSSQSSAPITVALADDDAMALAHLRSCLAEATDIQVLASSRSAHQVLDFLQSHKVSVLVTASHMAAMDGIEITREVRRASPQTHVILLSTLETDESLLRGLRAGASGFLVKSASTDELLSAVRAVHCGEKVVAPSLTSRLIDYALTSTYDADGSITLSARERDVLYLLCEGSSNRAIASRLAIAEATVKTHVSMLFDKTGARSRLEIVVWAFRHGYASRHPLPAAPLPATPC